MKRFLPVFLFSLIAIACGTIAYSAGLLPDAVVKIDQNSTNSTVKISTAGNTVKMDSTTNTVKIDGTTNTVKVDATTNVVKVDAGTGFLAVASKVVSASADAAAIIGTLPTGTKVVTICCDGTTDVNIGGAAVASGIAGLFVTPLPASGPQSVSIPVSSVNPTIYIVGRSGAATATILAR